jgi:hypothetical protein
MTNKKDDDLPTSVLHVDTATGRPVAQPPLPASPPQPAQWSAQGQTGYPPQPGHAHTGQPHGGYSGQPQGSYPQPGYPQPAPHHTGQPHPGQPYGGQPYGGQPHGGQPHGGQPHGGQAYGGQTYGSGQPHGGQPHGGQAYGGQAHTAHPHTGQPHTGQPHQAQPHQAQPQAGYGHTGRDTGYSPHAHTNYPPAPTPAAYPASPAYGTQAPAHAAQAPAQAGARELLTPELDWAPGMLIAGRYRLERSLGSGGAGLVVVAEDLLLRRKVAVKALRPEVAKDPENVDRFRKEVAICHGITHPNIVRTYDLGVDRGIHYFSMEYIDGRPLDALLEEKGKLRPGEVRELGLRILRALEVAHRAKVVHRDLKPSNIMLVDDERKCIVMDFGISGLVNEMNPRPEVPDKEIGPVLQRMAAAGTHAAARFDVTSAGFGTPKFMSPEQWLGRPVGASSDIYTMGCILFLLLTGRGPFEATEDVVYASLHIGEPPPRLRDVDASLPRDLDAAVARCLEKDPSKRFQSAAELAEAIAPRKTGKAIVRFALRAAGLALALALLAGGVISISHRALIREMRPAAQRLAELVSLRMPVTLAELDAIQTSDDVEHPAFIRVRDYFNEVADQNPEVEYIYVMRGLDDAGRLMFVIDKDAGIDLNGNGIIDDDERGDAPGTEYDGAELPEMMRALNEGVPSADEDFVWDMYGLSLSGYAPVGDTRGTGGYIVGVDLKNDHLVLFDRLVVALCAVTWLLLLLAPALLRKLRGKRALASGETATYASV